MTAFQAKFGKDHAALTTKAFSKKVCELWKGLRDKSGVQPATEHFTKFVEQLPDSVVKTITDAKSGNGTASRDEQRITTLENAFNTYCTANGNNA